ncbi:MAG: TIR domain-containing protein [Clostridia bacterium]|nr:TIR domain-containing protein [Clostridia bacterium]
MKKQVFISYKAEERAQAEGIKARIEAAGFSCWMAPESIPGGSSYAAEIENAIRDCTAFVLVFSEKAMRSTWVEKEIDRAINNGKLILPFRTESFSLSTSFSYYLTNVQFYEAYEDYEVALAQLIERLKENCTPDLPVKAEEKTPEAGEDARTDLPKPGKSPKTQKAAKMPRQKHKKKAKKILLAILASVLALVAIVVAIMVAGNRKILIAGNEVSVSSYALRVRDRKLTKDDIKNINKLKGLGEICLENCGLNDETAKQIKAFSADYKSRLRTIDLSENEGFTDLSLLENVSKLNLLDVSNTGIAGFEGLSRALGEDGFSSQIIADGCRISSFNNLVLSPDKPSALAFSLNGCGLTDQLAAELGNALAEMGNVTGLNIGNNPEITGLSFLSDFTSLKRLDVSNTGLRDFKGIEKCIYLESLRANDCGLTSTAGLENTTLLTTVMLNGAGLHVADLAFLKNSSAGIQNLFLGNNNFEATDAAALQALIAPMRQLVMLDLRRSAIQDVSFLNDKAQLAWLNLADNAITDFACLGSLEKLASLDLSGNQLASFDLGSLPESMKVLNLSNNSIAFEDPVISCNLDCLDLHGCTYQTISVPGYCRWVMLDYVDAADYTNGFQMKEIKMAGCPLNRQVALSEIFGDKIEYVDYEEYETYAADLITAHADELLSKG